MTFKSLDFTRIAMEDPKTYTGYFLGIVGSPAAYEQADLGPIPRIIFLDDDGQLRWLVASGRWQRVTTVAAPKRCQIVVHPKTGKSNLVTIGFDESFDEAHFQATLDVLGVEWDGSAAAVWGDEYSIDVPPMTFPEVTNYLQKGYGQLAKDRPNRPRFAETVAAMSLPEGRVPKALPKTAKK